MQGVLTRSFDWRLMVTLMPASLLMLANVLLFLYVTGPIELLGSPAVDWNTMRRGAALAGDPTLYADRGTSTFVWSPLAAFALQLIAPLDPWAWRGVLVAGALALPTWPLRLVVIASWPFWMDVATGNVMTLIFLSSVWALRGSQVGTFAFFTFAMLRPMPLLAPMCLWIVWKRSEWRLRVAAMFAVNALLVAWVGLGPDWLSAVASAGPDIQSSGYNMGPSRFLGWWWLLIGLPLGAWLFRTGRVGWAGLALSPYVWSYYLLGLLPTLNKEKR